MRTREEIEKISQLAREEKSTAIVFIPSLCLEVLLDIRDLLANPPMEITGSDGGCGLANLTK